MVDNRWLIVSKASQKNQSWSLTRNNRTNGDGKECPKTIDIASLCGKKHRPLIAMKIAHRQTIMLDVIAKHWPSVNTSKRLAHGLTSHLKSRKHIPIQNSEMCPMCMEDTGLPRKREPCVSWNSASSSISGGIRSRQPRPGLALQPLWVRARWAQYLKENLSGVNK